MSDISNTIRLNDQMSDPLKKISGNVDKLVSQLEQLNGVNRNAADPSPVYNSTADSLNNLFVAAGGYKVMQMVGSAFKESASAAIEFESAITGVYKTVDGTAEQLQGLSDAVREMSREMPSSVTEIAGVMEAAGQLGIATENVASFSKTMIDLGNSTNMTADQAASSLAKLANITGMSADNYSNLGSVIVDLGNNFATTEQDIVNMSTYFTSTASVAGLLETDIMALAAAMSSVGINAEAGGSAMSKLLSQMQTAVEVGGEDLQAFADVAGMTAQDFTTMWGTNAVGALQAFVSGLNDVERNGRSMSIVLQDMNLDDIRMSNMLKALASGSDVLTSAVQTANKAWQENTALTNEADKRYNTLESKMQMLSNSANDLQIAIGDSLTPTISGLVDWTAEAMNGLADWSKANQGATASIMGAVGAVGTAIGGFTTLAPAITAVSTAAKALDMTLSMSKIGLVLGIIAAAGAALGGIAYAFSSAKEQVEDYNGTLEECAAEIESTRIAHEKAVELYGAESDAAGRLQGQLDTLNAQYEKGGGAAADYAQRIEENLKAFKALRDEYNNTISGFESSQDFAITAISQLEALEDKANKTNPDLELMGKYADYLNDTFHCNIVVDYNTGDITGLDPKQLGSQIQEQGRQNERQAAYDTVTGDKFRNAYRTSWENASAAMNNAKKPMQEIDALIEKFDPNHMNQKLYDANGNLLEKYRSVYDFEKYNYQALAADASILFGGYTGDTQVNASHLSDALKKYAGGDKSIIADLESAVKGYREQRDFAGKQFDIYGTPDQKASYLAGITNSVTTSTKDIVINSAHDLEMYKDVLNGTVDEESAKLTEFGQLWHDVMTDGGLTAQETADLINAMPDELQGSMASYISEIQKVGEEYASVYNTVKQNFDGVFSLFDKAEDVENRSIWQLREADKSQLEYWQNWNENVEYFSTFTADSLGLTKSEFEAFNKGFDDIKQQALSGSQEMSALMDSVYYNIKKGEKDAAIEIVTAHGKVLEERAKAEGETTEWVTEAEKKAKDIYDKYHEAVSKMEHLETPMRSAAFSIMNAYAQGITAHSDMAIQAAQNVANQITAILSTPTISVGASTISGIMNKVTGKGYATGTMNAAPGLALVGENGPELINFGGGEVVYTAAETRRMISDVYIPSSVHEALGMEHSIGGLSSSGYYTAATPKEEDELKLSDSDREYLIALGERSAVNSAASNDIKIEMVNNNNISSEADVDGIIDHLARGLQNALAMTAEGVHK